jgi:zinc protease
MTLTLTKPFSQLNQPTLKRLPNGLTVIAESMPVDAVNLSLWLNVGSAAETNSINGMAHFLEHMVFKGTAQLRGGEFEQLVEGRGAVTNAATSQDYTHYYITTAPQDFAALAPHQIDIVLNASIPDASFEQERLVVLEEIRRSDDNSRRRTFQHAMDLAFPQLPYRRSVLGPADVIEQLTPTQMRTFHTTHYQSSAITAIAVGNLPVDELIEVVVSGFDQQMQAKPRPIAIPSLNTPNPLALEAPFTQIVRKEVVDHRLQQARLVMLWRVPGIDDLAQTYGLDVIASILGHGRTSRLIQDLREKLGLVNSIGVSNLNYQAQGVFYVIAQLPMANVQAAEAAIADHIYQLQIESVSDVEMTRIQRQVANRFVFGNETPSDRANLYGYYYALTGSLNPALGYPAQIQTLTAADIQQAAQRYLSPTCYGVVTLKPEA